MSTGDVFRKQQIAEELEEPVEEANSLAEKIGLEPYQVKYWIVDQDEMNQLAAYGGFQERYPHWRWGMQYDRQQKKSQYGGGKIFEMVNNDDPSHAFLQESNSVADQKAVITHVEAHSDFFANNEWFRMFADDLNASQMLARHGEKIGTYMEDADISREEVERFIDSITCLEDNIDQHRAYKAMKQRVEEDDTELSVPATVEEALGGNLEELSDDVKREIFDDEWFEQYQEQEEEQLAVEQPEKDVLKFLRDHGQQYNDESGKAEEFEAWQKDVLDMMRAESYYFGAQKMTKIMNEGWASYWESLMMGGERFADEDEFLNYADHMAQVLASPGLNPYSLGKQMWEHIENSANREDVATQLLQVEEINADNFDEVVDYESVLEVLSPAYPLREITEETLHELYLLDDEKVDAEALDRAMIERLSDDTVARVADEDVSPADVASIADREIDIEAYPWKVLSYDGLAERHYSLVQPQNQGSLERISQDDLDWLDRQLNDAGYDTVDEALEDVNYTEGWDKMFDVRASHNDVTFLDEFLTQEFVEENGYFAYEHHGGTDQFHVSSTDVEDVRKKLLLQTTNFGKPTIEVHDGNWDNKNELMLAHNYNGVQLNEHKAAATLKRTYDLWGRPVNLATVVKRYDENDREQMNVPGGEYPEPEEVRVQLRYDGNGFSLAEDPDDLSEIAALDASAVDYDTKPDEWI